MSHRASRPLLTVAALAGLAAAFAAGSVLSGPGDPQPSPDRTAASGLDDTSPVAFKGSDLSLASSCEDLLDWYVDRGVARVGPWGWNTPYPYLVDGDVIMNSSRDSAWAAAGSEASGLKAPAPATSRVTNGGTGTNVQENGVDEPDVVKTDGRTLYRVEGGDLVTYDVTGTDVTRLGSAELTGLRGAEILLAGDTVVAIAAEQSPSPDGYAAASETTRMLVFDVSDTAAPELEHSYTYDTALVTARLHGSTIRLVLQAGLPDLDFVNPDEVDRNSEREATHENQQVVRDSTIEDWLPTVSTDGGPAEQLLDCEDVAIPDDGTTLGTIAVVGFDAVDPGAPSVSGLAVETDLAYASASRLYLATTPYSAGWGWSCFDCERRITTPRWFPGVEDGTSHVYAFEFDGLDTTYTASGEIDGLIRDRWAMDEYDGVLRLAVGPTAHTGNFNSILTLRQEGNDLIETGRLDKLGVNEEIQAVRWFDSLAILVTFRQIDPLYAIDLSDDANPKLLGKLKIPGFSGYLHPLGGHRLLGLGEGPGKGGRWGAQAGLFNVTDLTNPRQIDVVSYDAGSRANAVDDPRQLTWLPDERVVLSVVTEWGTVGGATGYVSVLQLGDGQLSNRMVEVEYGDEVTAVRLVPLPDGRVVLVTGDGAEFFDL